MSEDHTIAFLHLQAEKLKEAEASRALRDQMREEASRNTTRYRRAQLFASQIMALLSPFLPSDRDCFARVYETLLETAFAQNVVIMAVPPELDALAEQQLRTALRESMLAPFMVKD